MRWIHLSPVDSPHKCLWRGALMFSLISALTNGWTNNRDAGDLIRHRAHYDVTVISLLLDWQAVKQKLRGRCIGIRDAMILTWCHCNSKELHPFRVLIWELVIRFILRSPATWIMLRDMHVDHRTLRLRHNGRESVSNHQPHHCLLNHLFRHRSKKTSKLRVTDLCLGSSPGTGDFPAQISSNAENVSIWWRHH